MASSWWLFQFTSCCSKWKWRNWACLSCSCSIIINGDWVASIYNVSAFCPSDKTHALIRKYLTWIETARFSLFFSYCIWFHGWVSSAHWTADDGSWIRTRLLIELIRINWRLFSFHCYNLEYQQSSPDTQWVCALCVCFGRRFFFFFSRLTEDSIGHIKPVGWALHWTDGFGSRNINMQTSI